MRCFLDLWATCHEARQYLSPEQLAALRDAEMELHNTAEARQAGASVFPGEGLHSQRKQESQGWLTRP